MKRTVPELPPFLSGKRKILPAIVANKFIGIVVSSLQKGYLFFELPGIESQSIRNRLNAIRFDPFLF